MYKKLIKDGKVAVLVSPGFGAGWSTWGDEKEALCMDGDLAEAFLERGYDGLIQKATEKYPDEYKGGLGAVYIEWLPIGTIFEIEEYDGSESLHIIGSRDYMVA